MTKMNWTKVRQQKLMERPTTNPTNKQRKKNKFIPPTEKQLKYMKALGIPYKQGMSLNDCSSLISYAKERSSSKR